MTTRRQFLKATGVVAVSSPFLLADYLSSRARTPLRDNYGAGEVLTAESWNALVRRVNELSQQL